ncbi:DinB family protein [Marininema halotolerans]|uniref:Uncharacterized damage-inducible protein DinB (Forms a four-helix bundle) n=1 Tax=Marininema halotolerans TaxID=1155944 RepID=A0A1I6STU9_9BACL|nr:DinB family protein [Marininema halotolerans]SFS80331.1 Uncharacterized damage-inducible protein DinB (forms a four-helix bundle) [Marininema halotolerans]
MNTIKRCQQLGEMTYFIRSLATVSTDQWRKPIAEGKWSAIEVVAHLHFWDRYLVEYALPDDFTRETWSELTIENMNRKASIWACSGVSCHEVIKQFLTFREGLLRFLNRMPPEDWGRTLRMGKHTLTLAEYIQEAIDHDQHHRSQLEGCFSENLKGGFVP